MGDGSTQTDLGLSDISNFETYKDWYVNESWTAFAQFATFRKDILKQVKDDYVTNFKSNKKKTYNKRKSRASENQIPKKSKKQKIKESSEFNFGYDDGTSESHLRTSLQKTGEIIVKTNRPICGTKRAKQSPNCNELQEFSGQAFLEKPFKTTSNSGSVSDGIQAELKVDSKDTHTQAIGGETAATSTQTLSEGNRNSDVGMQFPPDEEMSYQSILAPLYRDISIDTDSRIESRIYKDVGI